MSFEIVRDHWTESVADYILEQFKGSENWKSVLKSVIDKYTYIEGEIWKLALLLDFKKRVKGEFPEGPLLDFIAGLVGVERVYNESDIDFYRRFIVEIEQKNEGTPDSVIYKTKILAGGTEVIYLEDSDTRVVVYLPEVESGPRHSQINSLVPVGVMGIVGAALQFVDGDTMCDVASKDLSQDSQKKIMLAAADE